MKPISKSDWKKAARRCMIEGSTPSTENRAIVKVGVLREALLKKGLNESEIEEVIKNSTVWELT